MRAFIVFSALLAFQSLLSAGEAEQFNYDETKVGDYTLPDVLKTQDGRTVSDVKLWESVRRPEILELFKTHVYGRSPGRPQNMTFKVVNEVPDALGGTAVGKQIEIAIEKDGRTLVIHASLFAPLKRKPAPAFLLICNRDVGNIDFTREKKSPFWPAEEIVARGYAAVAFWNGDVDPDSDDGFKNGIHGLLDGDAPRAGDDWGTLSAWAWGASRVLDYLETDTLIDAKKVAVLGHSRGGKTALWAGAQDPRFALTISNCSGCGGAALSRRNFGETLARITKSFPHWFCANYKQYAGNEKDLPLDQHMLIALMAPRAVYVASAQSDGWADPKGEYLGLYHAGSVFALYGQKVLPTEQPPAVDTPVRAECMAYHMRTGKHNLLEYDWNRYMDFADQLWGKFE
jgi:pimeloyl-ACP methyl ester carboxylesterase